jgi:hypothetical protein
VVAPTPLPNDLIEQLRAVKPDLISLLSSTAPTDQPGETWTARRKSGPLLSNLTAARHGEAQPSHVARRVAWIEPC